MYIYIYIHTSSILTYGLNPVFDPHSSGLSFCPTGSEEANWESGSPSRGRAVSHVTPPNWAAKWEVSKWFNIWLIDG